MKNAENDRLSPANIQKRIQDLQKQMEKMPEYERGAVSYGVTFNSSVLVYRDPEPGVNHEPQPSQKTRINNNQNKRSLSRLKKQSERNHQKKCGSCRVRKQRKFLVDTKRRKELFPDIQAEKN